MGVVKGVILHSSILFADDCDHNDAPTLRSGADFLFRALQFSQFHKHKSLATKDHWKHKQVVVKDHRKHKPVVDKDHHKHKPVNESIKSVPCSNYRPYKSGILIGEDLSINKVNLLKTMSEAYSFDCFRFNNSAVDLVMEEITMSWNDVGKKILFVLSSDKMDCWVQLCDHGFLLSIFDVDAIDNTNKHPNVQHIKKLEELPLRLCLLNKKVASNKVLTVGYSMKPSRQADFAKRGAFPLYSVQHELMFLPLSFELSLPLQLQETDVILHKATDDIVSIELNSSLSPKITYTNGMEDLRRALEDQPCCCVIDPFNNIYPVMDRLKIQYLLLGLEDLNNEGCSKIRGPHFLKVDSYNDPNLTERLLEAKVSLPSIVKPQVACGLSSAHSMAIVFTFEDYKLLEVPLPAIIQEYIDHSSTLFKFYVLGKKVFHAVKKSTPNGDMLMKMTPANQLKPLVFDSLKSLPTAEKNHFSDDAVDLELVKNAAHWLRKKLDLTIFGFDVVIQEVTGDHVIVDVNYLPSFKEVPDDIAIPAFWEAITNKFMKTQEMISST